MGCFYIFYGNDIPLKIQKIKELENKILLPENNFQQVVFDDTNKEEIHQTIENGDLFSSKYLLKVKKIKGSFDFSSWYKNEHTLFLITDEEKDPFPKESNSLLIKINCMLPKHWDIAKILQKELSVSVNPEVIEFISRNISSLLDIQEIKKQLLYYKIQELNLHNMGEILPSVESDIFALVDYFFDQENRSKLFLEGLENLLKNNNSIDPLISSLLRKTNDFISIKKYMEAGVSQEDISKKMKIHPFILEKMVITLKKYTKDVLQKLAVKILETQFLSRFYSSRLDKILVTKLFLEQKNI